jgi:hypothetical protein
MTARLTANESATIRRAYRDACASGNISRALDAMYAKYVQLYGLSLSELQEVALEDKILNPKIYQAMYAARDQERKQQEGKRAEPKNRLDAQKQAERKRKERRGAYNAKVQAERKAERQRAVANPGYYTQSTYCPVCRRNLGREYMPPHGGQPRSPKPFAGLPIGLHRVVSMPEAPRPRTPRSGSSPPSPLAAGLS